MVIFAALMKKEHKLIQSEQEWACSSITFGRDGSTFSHMLLLTCFNLKALTLSNWHHILNDNQALSFKYPIGKSHIPWQNNTNLLRRTILIQFATLSPYHYLINHWKNDEEMGDRITLISIQADSVNIWIIIVRLPYLFPSFYFLH